jgi:hypothetical protein
VVSSQLCARGVRCSNLSTCAPIAPLLRSRHAAQLFRHTHSSVQIKAAPTSTPRPPPPPKSGKVQPPDPPAAAAAPAAPAAPAASESKAEAKEEKVFPIPVTKRDKVCRRPLFVYYHNRLWCLLSIHFRILFLMPLALRSQIANEVMTSERTYVTRLHTLYEVFLEPLLNDSNRLGFLREQFFL